MGPRRPTLRRGTQSQGKAVAGQTLQQDALRRELRWTDAEGVRRCASGAESFGLRRYGGMGRFGVERPTHRLVGAPVPLSLKTRPCTPKAPLRTNLTTPPASLRFCA